MKTKMKHYPIEGCWIAPGLFSPKQGLTLMGGYKINKPGFSSDGLSGPLKAMAVLDLERFGHFFPVALAHDWKCAGNVPGMTFTQANNEMKRDFIALGLDPDLAEMVRDTIEQCGTQHWDLSPKPVLSLHSKVIKITLAFFRVKISRLLSEKLPSNKKLKQAILVVLALALITTVCLFILK